MNNDDIEQRIINYITSETKKSLMIGGNRIRHVRVEEMDAVFIEGLDRDLLVQIVWNALVQDKKWLVLWRYSETQPWNLDALDELLKHAEVENE